MRHDQRGFPFPGPYRIEQHGGHEWHWAIPLAFLVLMTLAFLWLVFQTRGGRLGPRTVAVAGAADTALAELRLRYARGEVTREEFLATETDLRGDRPPPSSA